ncbi:outer membrane lipoprotein [Providencia rustigianii]
MLFFAESRLAGGLLAFFLQSSPETTPKSLNGIPSNSSGLFINLIFSALTSSSLVAFGTGFDIFILENPLFILGLVYWLIPHPASINAARVSKNNLINSTFLLSVVAHSLFILSVFIIQKY